MMSSSRVIGLFLEQVLYVLFQQDNGPSSFLSLLCLDYFQLVILCLPNGHIWEWPALGPYKSKRREQPLRLRTGGKPQGTSVLLGQRLRGHQRCPREVGTGGRVRRGELRHRGRRDALSTRGAAGGESGHRGRDTCATGVSFPGATRTPRASHWQAEWDPPGKVPPGCPVPRKGCD